MQLDEKAQLLLKNLLDGAAERVFEAHSELLGESAPQIISAHLKDMLKQRSSNLANVSEQISPTFFESTAKGPRPQKVALSNKDERVLMMMMMPSISKPSTTVQHSPGLEQQSKPSFSVSTPENRRKKRCRVCRQSSVKQLKSTEESTLPKMETQNPSKDVISLQHQLFNLPTKFHFGHNGPSKQLGSTNKATNNSARSAERQRQKRNISEFNHNPYDLASSLKNAAAEIEEGSHIDKEAYDAIEQIESCIAALQQVVVLAKQVGSQNKKLLPQLGFLHANSSICAAAEPTDIELRERRFPNQSMDGASSSAIRKVEKNKAEYEVLNQSVPSHNVKAILEKIESLRWVVASQNDYMPTKLPNQINNENFDRNLMAQKETMKKGGTISQPSISSVGSTGADRRIQTPARATSRRGKGLPGETRNLGTLLDHKYNPVSYERHQVDQERGLVQTKNSRVGPQRAISAYQVESGATSSSLCTSSSWTSQQASITSSGSGSEEYPPTSREHYMSPSTGCESEVYSLPDKTRGCYAGTTNSSDSVPSTTRLRQVGSTSSSESSGYLPSDQSSTHHRVGIAYRTVGSTSTPRRIGCKKNGDWIKPEKQIGRLRKLRDKLAIIFHHHHHHHHYHHHHDDDDDDDDRYDREAKVRRGTSLFKNKSKDEGYGEQAVENARKSVVRNNVGNKKQRGHLRTLVEGLLNHLRHSKKSKPSMVGIGRLENGQHMGKKAVKKLHWWQMLRRHRAGVKVPNKQRGKLGLGAKGHPQVKALPKLR